MLALPVRARLDHLRRQARDLLRSAQKGDREAQARIRAVSDRTILASARLAVAREYGFSSWSSLRVEVERREILTTRDLSRLTELLQARPALARRKMENWCDHRRAEPLGFVAMLGFDHDRLGLPPDLTGTGAVARALLDAGAPVDGHPNDPETPLITAASYGDVEVARVLIEAGATLEAVAAPHAGGVPGGTALLHAAVFGMTDVLDLLVESGARIGSVEEAAAAGDIANWLMAYTPAQARVRALVMAADHQRLPVIDQLLAAGTPIDVEDESYGRQALRTTAENGRPNSIRHLLANGADPNHKDPVHGRTALEWARRARRSRPRPGHAEVEGLLVPVTTL